MQTTKDQENPGEMTIKLEGQVKSDPDQTDEKQQFNGHLDPTIADIVPKVEDAHLQSKDAILSSSLRPPTRDLTPANHRMMVGPGSQPEAPPPNCLAPIGPQMAMMPGGGGGMPMGGQMQIAPGGHFVQNQSPIFVFSTKMANLAADSCERGQSENIIQFHKNLPNTRQFLQKFHMDNHCGGMGMNMRPEGAMRQPNMIDGIPESGSALANVAQWVQQQNANLQSLSSHSPGMNFGGAPEGHGMRPNGRYGRMQQWNSSPGPHLMPPDMVGPAGYPMCGSQAGFPQEMNMGPGDMIHDPMAKDNLTPQQLQKREQSLANLRKIGEMLLPELQSNMDLSGAVGASAMRGPHGNHEVIMPGDGWPPPMMHPNMGLQRPGMPVSPSDPMGNANFMQRMGPGRPFVGPGAVPPNWETMSQQQRDWWKVQQHFYMEKYQKQQMQMGMNMPPGGVGSNRSHMGFLHSSQQMHQGPMSPSFSGPSGPSPHCGPMGMPNDPQSMMFNKQAEFGAVGPDPNFDLPGGMGREGMFQFGDNQMPPGASFGNMGEPFSPTDFSHPINQPGMGKMGPGYGPQKRKRSNNFPESDDFYKRLLPAPSPQQFSYMNTLEGQELKITKQLNHAFQEQPGSQPPLPTSSSPPTYPPPPQKSRPTGGKKKKTQSKAAEQKAKSQRTPPTADSFMCPSPAVASSTPSTASASCQPTVPTASPITQMAMSLPNTTAPNPTAVSNRAPSVDPSTMSSSGSSTTAPIKSSMTNITSASLANLAKGVENLSAQIQQNPFRTVQMQENESDVSDVSPADNGLHPPSVSSSSHNQTAQAPTSGVGAGPFGGVQPCNSSMQPVTPTNPLGSPQGSVRSASHSAAPKQGSSNLIDPAGLISCRQSPAMFSGEDSGLESGSRFGFSGSSSLSTGPTGSQQMFSSIGSSPGMSGPSGCRPTNNGGMVTGNAKIQIQAQTPNTIQYLPSHPSSSGGGLVGDAVGDNFVGFGMDKSCGKGPMMSQFGSMMDGPVMPGDMRRQMDMQMGPDVGAGGIHSQMRMEAMFDLMNGGRGPMHNMRNSMPGAGGGGHMAGGPMQDPTSPMIGPNGMMHGMGVNSVHPPGSPIMGHAGQMHDQTSPMMASGAMMGVGGHMLDMHPMQGHLKPGMGPNGSADFGPVMVGPGGRGGEMPPEMGMPRQAMHPDAMMMSMGGPEFGIPLRESAMMQGGPGCMGPDMGMVPMSSREAMVAMRAGPGGMRPELVADRSRMNRSRQKGRVVDAEVMIRNDPVAGLMGPEAGGNRMVGSNPAMMGMDMLGGMMRPDMGVMGGRPEMMPGVPGDRVGMRHEPGMMPRGNAMPQEMAMMSSRGMPGGRVGIVDGPGMSPEAVGMFGYGPGRRGMPPDGIDMCQPGMIPSGMNAPGMCPPGMKSMVMSSPAIGQSPGPGMVGDAGYGTHYPPFQQQMYAQSQSPTMSSVMMRGGPPDMMGRPPYDMIGSGPGSGMGFGQPQPGIGPSGPM